MEISTEESPRLGLGLILVQETSHSSLQTQCSILFMTRHWEAAGWQMYQQHIEIIAVGNKLFLAGHRFRII